MKSWIIACLCSPLLLASPHSAFGDDLEDFLKRWNEAREASSRRHEDFNRYREQRYRDRYRAERQGDVNWEGPVRGYSPGYYNVPVPGGEDYRIHVQERGRRAQQTTQILEHAQDMQPYVRTIGRAVQRTDDAALRQRAGQVERDLEQMIQAARRNDMNALRTHHQRFDTNWPQLVHGINQYQWDRRMHEYLDRVHDSIQDIHQILSGLSPDEYDRLRLIALSRKLRERTEDLEDDLQDGTGRRAFGLRHQARRVAAHAEDFADIVERGADRRTIVDEFRQFDDDWHTMLNRLDDSGIDGERAVRLRREIWPIDHELHQLLLVEAPDVPDDRSIQNLIRQIADSGNHLATDLRITIRDLGESDRAVERKAWQVYDAVVRFNEMLESMSRTTDGGQRRGSRLRQLDEQWQQIAAGMNDLPRGYGFRHAREAAETLDHDLRRLQDALRGESGWRYTRYSGPRSDRPDRRDR